MGPGTKMPILDDLYNTYNDVTGLLNQQVGDIYDTYKKWGEQNRKLIPDILNNMVDYGESIAQTPGMEFAIPTLPMMGATWAETRPKLLQAIEEFEKLKAKQLSQSWKQIHPLDAAEITNFRDSKSKLSEALKSLSDDYPTITQSDLVLDTQHPYVSSVYRFPEYKTFEDYYDLYPKPSTPGVITIRPGSMMKQGNPLNSYAHESGHALVGSYPYLSGTKSWGKDYHKRIFEKEPELWLASAEGFADGFGNSLLNRYNNRVPSTYWRLGHFREDPYKSIYLPSGMLGESAGRMIREGKPIDYLEYGNELNNILTRALGYE